MNFIFVSLILSATVMSPLIIYGNEKIDGNYYHKNRDCKTWNAIEVLCDDYYKSDTVKHCSSFVSSEDVLTSEKMVINEISFNCSMPYLENNLSTILKDYSELNVLNLSSINLLLLEKKNLKNVPANLSDAVFSHNNLTKIPSNVFVHNENLRSVDFSFNRISEIEAFAFADATKLEIIDISHNLLKTITKDMFRGNENLRIVNISFNQITKIDESNLYIKVIDILTSNPRIISLFPFSKSSHPVNMSYNRISKLNSLKDPRALEVIDLSNNLLTEIPTILLDTSLRFINLSSNRISDTNFSHEWKAKNLEKFYISNNPLDHIVVNFTDEDCYYIFGIFVYHWKYNFCYPDNFASITNISSDIPISTKITLSRDIAYLDASGIKINRIDVLDTLEQLQHLNISGCEIENMNEVLKKLDSHLVTFDASFNYIGKLDYSSFIKLENLKYLSLKSTHLSEIEFINFLHLRNLKTLDISYNDLKVIQFNFQTIYHWDFDWESLYLDGNNLSEFDDNLSESHFPSLKVISISNNHFDYGYLLNFTKSWKTLQLDKTNELLHRINSYQEPAFKRIFIAKRMQ